jgi:hypothetical protein
VLGPAVALAGAAALWLLLRPEGDATAPGSAGAAATARAGVEGPAPIPSTLETAAARAAAGGAASGPAAPFAAPPAAAASRDGGRTIWSLPAAGAPGAAASREARRAAGDVRWALRGAKVLAPGATVTIAADPETGQPGGTLTTGYVLEGKVKAQRGGFVPEGTFRLTLTAFRPDTDLPAQRAGLWHVQGRWTVVAADAEPEALKARHNPYVVQGRIHDALPFNPAEAEGAWSARATVPASWAAGSWVRGKTGTLRVDPGGGGELEIALAVGHGIR